MSSKAASVRTFRFDQMATLINDRVDNPAESGVEHYVGLEHLDTDSLRIRRWGEITDVESTKLRFQPGDIIFGKRRVYQRKLAVADFEGICSAHAMVLRAKENVALPEFLPFFMQSDHFMERALAISVGSLSPTINWTTLAAEEFVLPPIEEQRRLAACLSAVEAALDTLCALRRTADSTRSALLNELTSAAVNWQTQRISELCLPGAPLCYGVVQPGDHMADGVPLLRVCDIEARRVNHTALKRVSREIDQEYCRSRIQPDDVLVSVVGTIGRVYLATDLEAGFNIARAIARIRTNEACLPRYLVLLLQSPHFQRLMTGEAFETARKTLNLEALGDIEIPLPAITTQVEWSERWEKFGTADDDIQIRFGALWRLKSHILATISRGVAE